LGDRALEVPPSRKRCQAAKVAGDGPQLDKLGKHNYNGPMTPEQLNHNAAPVLDKLSLIVTRPPEPEPEKRIVACGCGGQLMYTSFASTITWLGQKLTFPELYGWVCSSCDVKLLHPSVGDELRAKMDRYSMEPGL